MLSKRTGAIILRVSTCFSAHYIFLLSERVTLCVLSQLLVVIHRTHVPVLNHYFKRMQWLPLLLVGAIAMLAVVNMSGLQLSQLGSAVRQASYSKGQAAIVQQAGAVLVVPEGGVKLPDGVDQSPAYTAKLEFHKNELKLTAYAMHDQSALNPTRGAIVLVPKQAKPVLLVSGDVQYHDMSQAGVAEEEWTAVRTCRSLKKQQSNILASKKPEKNVKGTEAYYWEQGKLVYVKNGINRVLTTQGELTGCEDRVQRWNALQEARAQLRNSGIAIEQYHVFVVDHFGSYKLASPTSLSEGTAMQQEFIH